MDEGKAESTREGNARDYVRDYAGVEPGRETNEAWRQRYTETERRQMGER